MSTPQDPYGRPDDGSDQSRPGPDQPPHHGSAPQYGSPPQYGAEGTGQPGYGAGYGAPPPGWGQPQKQGTNGLAIASLITAFLCWPLGLALGLVAKNQIKKTGQGGDALATAGIVVSVLNALLSIYLVTAGGFAAA